MERIKLELVVSQIRLNHFLEQVKRLTSENYIREFKAEYILNGKTEDEALRDFYPALAGKLGFHLIWIFEQLSNIEQGRYNGYID